MRPFVVVGFVAGDEGVVVVVGVERGSAGTLGDVVGAGVGVGVGVEGTVPVPVPEPVPVPVVGVDGVDGSSGSRSSFAGAGSAEVATGPPTATAPTAGSTVYVTGAATAGGVFRPSERYEKVQVIAIGQLAQGRSLFAMTADGEVGDNVIARFRPTSTLAVRFVATGAVRVTCNRHPTLLRTLAVDVAVTMSPEVRVTVITGAGTTPWRTACVNPRLVAARTVVCASTSVGTHASANNSRMAPWWCTSRPVTAW